MAHLLLEGLLRAVEILKHEAGYQQQLILGILISLKIYAQAAADESILNRGACSGLELLS